MADQMTELAKSGRWDTYKQTVKSRWEQHIENYQAQAANPSLDLEVDVLLMAANRLPIELWIEPDLWQAAQDKAGDSRWLKATIREMLKLWVAGDVDPWHQG